MYVCKHCVSKVHYCISNCLFVDLQAERMFGTRRFLMLYFGSGVFSNACTFAGGRSPYSLGASGCIFGLVGAFAAFYYKNRKTLGSVSTAGDLTYTTTH